MKAVEVHAYGGPEALRLVEAPAPVPGPGEVLIRQSWSGVNFFDTYVRKGEYAGHKAFELALPVRLGIEGAGRVAALGAGVRELAPGDGVGYAEVFGTYAEHVCLPADRVVPLPPDLDPRIAAAVLLQGMTAHFLVHDTFPLKSGHVCLIHAAAGGVGQLLVQMAKLAGARVLATVGSRDKAERVLALGADQAILYREHDFCEAARRATGGRGVDVVYDSVGRDTIDGSLRALRPRGVCALFGHASGRVESVAPARLGELGSLFLTRPHLKHHVLGRAAYQTRAQAVLDLVRTGRLALAIDGEFPLARAADAHRRLESRASQGKVLLAI